MTEEELKEKIKKVFDNYYTCLPIEYRHLRWTDEILAIPEIKEALDLREKLLMGWKLHPRKI